MKMKGMLLLVGLIQCLFLGHGISKDDWITVTCAGVAIILVGAIGRGL